jgi:hypothetical protein
MTAGIHIIKHEGVKDSGSFEVRFPDDRAIEDDPETWAPCGL